MTQTLNYETADTGKYDPQLTRWFKWGLLLAAISLPLAVLGWCLPFLMEIIPHKRGLRFEPSTMVFISRHLNLALLFIAVYLLTVSRAPRTWWTIVRSWSARLLAALCGGIHVADYMEVPWDGDPESSMIRFLWIESWMHFMLVWPLMSMIIHNMRLTGLNKMIIYAYVFWVMLLVAYVIRGTLLIWA